ncbi:MAG TPA: PKD domain-containing protein [Dermatophilaceae bacterium]|nr:PKD domain-containing protein [Dermatophilaceae bacterium]
MPRRSSAAVLALLVLPAVGAVNAFGAVIGGTPGPGLAAVGPVSASDGFPVWYRDKNGMRLELCLAQADPLCPARGPLPDEQSPVSFPDNFPDESFYSLTSTSVGTANGGIARADLALEAAFVTGPVIPGDQRTFARVRFKVTNVQDNVDYTFTSPAGTKTLQTSKPGLIFDTEDIGIGGPGDFTGALGGRIGPFLTWDTFGSKSDPALLNDTYVGDGATPHKITGSPYGTNFFRVQGPGINPSSTVDACPTVDGPVSDCVETDLFTVQGKLATTAGVTADEVTYSRAADGAGFVDVFASSEGSTESIQVSDPSATKTFATTGLTGENGHYFARVAFTGATPPANVRVSNVGDVPASVKTVSVVDQLSGTATYNTGDQTLVVTAGSSDTFGKPALTATGYGQLTNGQLTVSGLQAPPVSVALTSAAGGSTTLPIQVSGPGRDPLPVVAQAGPDQTVQPGQTVTLDGSASSGPVATYAWTNADGIAMTTPDQAVTTFTAPSVPGAYTFTLTVSGPGGPSTASVVVTVEPAAPLVANAGPDQTVQRGTKVTLDGSRSTGAASYAWTQLVGTGDPVVTLSGAATVRPTFTFPFYKSPATNGPLRFQLVVTAVDGTVSSPSVVTITPTSDVVTVTLVRYANSRWRIDGTSSILAGQTVTAHYRRLTGTVIGRAVVDVTGAFSVRSAGPVPVPGDVVVVESQLGGVSAPVTVRIG